jgi:hypothetical protein
MPPGFFCPSARGQGREKSLILTFSFRSLPTSQRRVKPVVAEDGLSGVTAGGRCRAGRSPPGPLAGAVRVEAKAGGYDSMLMALW